MKKKVVDKQYDESSNFQDNSSHCEDKAQISLNVNKSQVITVSTPSIDSAKKETKNIFSSLQPYDKVYVDKEKILNFLPAVTKSLSHLEKNGNMDKNNVTLNKHTLPLFCMRNVEDVTDLSETIKTKSEVVFVNDVNNTQKFVNDDLNNEEKFTFSTSNQKEKKENNNNSSNNSNNITENENLCDKIERIKKIKRDEKKIELTFSSSSLQNPTKITSAAAATTVKEDFDSGLFLPLLSSQKQRSLPLFFGPNLTSCAGAMSFVNDGPGLEINICNKTPNVVENVKLERALLDESQKNVKQQQQQQQQQTTNTTRTTNARGKKGRRLKKDAPSLFSVVLPTFDETTGALAGDFVFPKSLHVDVAIQAVLQQERGERRTKANGVGITRFLADFSESQEIIYTYFWYIIGHIRRVSVEKMLISRYTNLERVIRGVFPRYKAELLPIGQLEWILSKISRPDKKESEDRPQSSSWKADSFTHTNESVFGSPECTSSERAQSRCSGRAMNKEKQHLLSSGFSRQTKVRQGERAKLMLTTFNINQINEDPLDKKPTIVERCTEAIEAFMVLLEELCELSAFLRSCFHRLSVLFGQAFEQLTTDKDSVFNAFTFIVPHVTYYVMVYCFPNDVVAGLFDVSLRLNLYRIFYFWCSGITATYVHTSGWPVPANGSKNHQNAVNGDQKINNTNGAVPFYAACDILAAQSSGGESINNLIFNKQFAASQTSSQIQLNSLTQFSTGGINGNGIQNNNNNNNNNGGEETFDSVDVEVANGHHRIVQEFQRYASHVKHLVQQLEQRTTEMHKEKTGAIPLINSSTEIMGEQKLKEVKSNVSVQSTKSKTCGNKKNEKRGSVASVGHKYLSGRGDNYTNYINTLREINNPVKKDIQSVVNVNNDDKNKKHDTVLPGINVQSINRKPALKTHNNNNNNGGGSILSTFPLDFAAKNVKEYIISEAAGLLFKPPPLPPLDNNDALTFNHSVPIRNSSSLSRSDINFTTSTLRTIKGPMPLASPFFIYYAKKRSLIKKSFKFDNDYCYSYEKNEGKNISSPFRFSPDSTATVTSLLPEAAICEGPSQEGKLTERGKTTHKFEVNSAGGVVGKKKNNKSLFLPHCANKAINMTIIPLSDAHLRPLQFKNLTREVRKRQLVHEKQMDIIVEREQRLRQQYVAENQQSIRCVNKLLATSRLNNLEKMLIKNFRKRKLPKVEIVKRHEGRVSIHETEK